MFLSLIKFSMFTEEDGTAIVCIGVSIPPQKHHPLFFAKPPSLNLPAVQAPLFRQCPLYIGFSWSPPPLKVRFFSEPPKCYSFSSLTPSYFLKVTKLLIIISQFEFWVITEKNNFVYKLFLSLNISSGFSLFFM